MRKEPARRGGSSLLPGALGADSRWLLLREAGPSGNGHGVPVEHPDDPPVLVVPHPDRDENADDGDIRDVDVAALIISVVGVHLCEVVGRDDAFQRQRHRHVRGHLEVSDVVAVATGRVVFEDLDRRW